MSVNDFIVYCRYVLKIVKTDRIGSQNERKRRKSASPWSPERVAAEIHEQSLAESLRLKDLVLLHFAIERIAADLKHSGCLADIPAGQSKRLLDRLFFQNR